MLEHPIYVRMPTVNETPLFKNQSSAETVINAVVTAQRQNWMRLHGFVVMPEALEMVFTPIKQGVAGVIAQVQAETIPPLTILLPDAGLIWEKRYAQIALESQRALDARLEMMLLVPVANGICEKAEDYPYSSANRRYHTSVIIFTGYKKPATPSENGLSEALNAGRSETPPVRPEASPTVVNDQTRFADSPKPSEDVTKPPEDVTKPSEDAPTPPEEKDSESE
jgi:hypothetical protein